MLFSVFSPKGGTGCSVSAALVAHSLSRFSQTTLIDGCGGDLHAIVNPDQVPRYCFEQWCESPHPTSESLSKIAIEHTSRISLVTSRYALSDLHLEQPQHVVSKERQNTIVSSLSGVPGNCVVDLGVRHDSLSNELIRASDIAIVVLRKCYLSLQGAVRNTSAYSVDACVVVSEPGRTISTKDIAETLSIKNIIECEARRDFARSIDAGVLLDRTLPNLLSPFQAFIDDVIQGTAETTDIFEHTRMKNQTPFWAREPRPNFLGRKV